MEATLCGVRGSTQSPGHEFARHGGHTSCVALAHDGEPPTLLLDAGTGIRRVTDLLGGAPFRGTILLGHLHWDHTQGLPFFRSGDRADAVVRLVMPDVGDPLELLRRSMSPPHFPIGPEGLRGRWTFEAIEPGRHRFEGFDVLAREIPHKGGRTFGYRITDGTGTLAYLSDHCPTAFGEGVDGCGELHDTALELATGADVLIHDAQHTVDELAARAQFGHAAADYAVALGELAGVGRVVLFHHDPSRTDDELDAIEASFQGRGVAVEAATEGRSLVLPLVGAPTRE